MATQPVRRLVLLVALISFPGLLVGCLEHRFIYRFDPNDRCQFSYQVSGDSTDLYTPRSALPDSLIFRITTRTQTDTAGKVSHILEANANFYADYIPATVGLKEVPWTQILLQHPVYWSPLRFFFLTLNRFEMIFQGRHRLEREGDHWKYIPPECRVLEDKADSTLAPALRAELEEKYAAGMLLWNVDRYHLRFQNIVQQALALHPEVKVPEAWIDSALAETDSLVQAYSAQKQWNAPSGNLDTVNLEWWDSLETPGLHILMQNLNLLGDSSVQAEIPRVAELLELQHQVSEDLLDESFDVQVNLPGWVLKSNTNSHEKRGVVWKILGEELQEEDFPLQATSLYLYPWRIALGLVALLLLLVVLKRLKSRRSVVRP